MSKYDGGKAFPRTSVLDENSGMTLRDYFAAKAMQATITNPDSVRSLNELSAEDGARVVANVAYMMADAMLAERAK